MAQKGKPKGLAKSGGRKKGTPNKVTKEIKELAQLHAAAAIKELARLMIEAESETARVSAIKEILDRGYGKAPQAITGGDGEALFPKLMVTYQTNASERG